MSNANTARLTAQQRLTSALGAGDSPFPWQLALLDRFLEGNLPSAIDVPTGLGKTAVIAIWLVARAAGASVPRRLVYVVDRRAVVDQATKVAEGLRGSVDRDLSLKADLGLEGPLPISTLRGKLLDNRQWLTDPAAPAIVLGTVDMIGSRLLFQGYGISNRMRPYHAGLLGVDTLVVLDEAHLTPPFERLVEAVASGRDGRGQSLLPEGFANGIVPPFRFLSLSATGRRRDDALTLSDADRGHPVVARRLRASKRVAVRDRVAAGDLAERLADEAWLLSHAGARPIRCIVFCDRRDDAVKVLDGLRAIARKASVEHIDTQLFVGGRRLYEREEAAEWLQERGFLAGSGGKPERATFVIATSAGEVGVDLDADHAVMDMVAWERMIQRLGRVNRRGDGDASVVVVPAISDDASKEDRLQAVHALLAELPHTADGTFDGSPAALSTLTERSTREAKLAERVSQASTPPDLHPPLARPTIEAWSMTSLEDHTGRPEVEPWIRGWIEEEEPQTTIAWRKYLPVTDQGGPLDRRDSEAFRESAAPHLAERLETETWRAVEWLSSRMNNIGAPGESNEQVDPSDRQLRKTDVIAVILDTSSMTRVLKGDDLSTKDKRDDIRRAISGRLLIVDVRLGGLERGLLSDDSDDASDLTLLKGESRVIPFRVRRSTGEGSEERSPEWRTEARIAVNESEEAETAWLLVESFAREAAESEEGRSVGAKRAQTLEEHEVWAEEAARRIAERLALPDAYGRMLAVAARLHDEGKRAKRWQQAFRAPTDAVYAKTTSRPNLKILDSYRHELGSLPYADKHKDVQALDGLVRDLCLHLIAAHHGHARPLLRTDSAEEPPTRLVQRAREIALRFSSLEKRWGPWGLAWWEALLRAADQQASRRNDEGGADRG